MHVNTPSGDTSFSWRFDDGQYAMELFRKRSTEQAVAQQAATPSSPAETQIISPGEAGDAGVAPGTTPPSRQPNWPSMNEIAEGEEISFE